MQKRLLCGDVVPDCPEEMLGATDEDVLRKAAEHARTAHGLERIDDQTLQRVKAAIRPVP